MFINFQQGIVTYPLVGTLQAFLAKTGVSVSLQTANGQTDIAFAQGDSNYLLTEASDVNNAWGPIPASTDTWLFWDIDLQTAVRTFGFTLIQPLFGQAPPTSGYQEVSFTISKVGTDATGLANDGTIYTAKVEINATTEYDILVVGSTAQTFTDLIAEIQGDVPGAVVSLVSGKIRITSNTTGISSTVNITDTDLFSSLTDFNAVDPAVNGQSDTRPTSPLVGQHFFDTSDKKMYVWEAGQWRNVIRTFAAKVNNAVFTPLGQGFPSTPYAGTQVGLSGIPTNAGRIIVDNTATPIRKVNGEYFTTEDDFFVNGSPVNTIRLEANVLSATAVVNLAAYQVVRYSAFGKINIATYNDLQTTVIAMLVEDLGVNDTGTVITQGTITNPAWNFTTVGAELWVDGSGVFTETDPHVSDPGTFPVGKPPIARVITPTMIFFDQGLGGKGDTGPAGGSGTSGVLATNSVFGVTKLSIAAFDVLNPIAAGDNDPRLSDDRQPLAHTHPATDILFTPYGNLTGANVQLALQELEDDKVDITGSTMTGLLTLSADPTLALHAATKNYVDTLALQGLADVTLIVPSVNDLLTYNGTVWTNRPAALFLPTDYLSLTDTPGSYGTPGSFVTVNSGGTGLDFTVLTAGTNITLTPGAGTLTISSSAAIAEPLNQIVFGTGPSVTSDPDFTYDPLTGALYVNSTDGITASVSVATPGTVGLFGADASVAATAGADINIIGGAGNTSGDGGDVNITAGSSPAGIDGIVTLTGGNGDTLEVGASIRMSTNSVERLEITTAGAWEVGGNQGSAGEILTSNGTGTPPTWQAGGGGSGSILYDIGGTVGGVPASSAIVFNYIATRTVTMQDDFAGSFAEAQVASTGSPVFDVQKNGGSIGSITFTTGTTGVFVTAGGGVEVLIPGDVLTIVAPGSPDATLSGIAITFFGEAGGDTFYDVGGAIFGVPTASEISINHVVVRTITMQDEFAGSFAEAQTAATGSPVFDVQKNGGTIGSITFSGTTGTFTTVGGGVEVLIPGDVLTVVAPGSPDATLADIAITFIGTV